MDGLLINLSDDHDNPTIYNVAVVNVVLFKYLFAYEQDPLSLYCTTVVAGCYYIKLGMLTAISLFHSDWHIVERLQ